MTLLTGGPSLADAIFAKYTFVRMPTMQPPSLFYAPENAGGVYDATQHINVINLYLRLLLDVSNGKASKTQLFMLRNNMLQTVQSALRMQNDTHIYNRFAQAIALSLQPNQKRRDRQTIRSIVADISREIQSITAQKENTVLPTAVLPKTAIVSTSITNTKQYRHTLIQQSAQQRFVQDLLRTHTDLLPITNTSPHAQIMLERHLLAYQKNPRAAEALVAWYAQTERLEERLTERIINAVSNAKELKVNATVRRVAQRIDVAVRAALTAGLKGQTDVFIRGISIQNATKAERTILEHPVLQSVLREPLPKLAEMVTLLSRAAVYGQAGEVNRAILPGVKHNIAEAAELNAIEIAIKSTQNTDNKTKQSVVESDNASIINIQRKISATTDNIEAAVVRSAAPNIALRASMRSIAIGVTKKSIEETARGIIRRGLRMLQHDKSTQPLQQNIDIRADIRNMVTRGGAYTSDKTVQMAWSLGTAFTLPVQNRYNGISVWEEGLSASKVLPAGQLMAHTVTRAILERLMQTRNHISISGGYDSPIKTIEQTQTQFSHSTSILFSALRSYYTLMSRFVHESESETSLVNMNMVISQNDNTVNSRYENEIANAESHWNKRSSLLQSAKHSMVYAKDNTFTMLHTVWAQAMAYADGINTKRKRNQEEPIAPAEVPGVVAASVTHTVLDSMTRLWSRSTATAQITNKKYENKEFLYTEQNEQTDKNTEQTRFIKRILSVQMDNAMLRQSKTLQVRIPIKMEEREKTASSIVGSAGNAYERMQISHIETELENLTQTIYTRYDVRSRYLYETVKTGNVVREIQFEVSNLLHRMVNISAAPYNKDSGRIKKKVSKNELFANIRIKSRIEKNIESLKHSFTSRETDNTVVEEQSSTESGTIESFSTHMLKLVSKKSRTISSIALEGITAADVLQTLTSRDNTNPNVHVSGAKRTLLQKIINNPGVAASIRNATMLLHFSPSKQSEQTSIGSVTKDAARRVKQAGTELTTGTAIHVMRNTAVSMIEDILTAHNIPVGKESISRTVTSTAGVEDVTYAETGTYMQTHMRNTENRLYTATERNVNAYNKGINIERMRILQRNLRRPGPINSQTEMVSIQRDTVLRYTDVDSTRRIDENAINVLNARRSITNRMSIASIPAARVFLKQLAKVNPGAGTVMQNAEAFTERAELRNMPLSRMAPMQTVMQPGQAKRGYERQEPSLAHKKHSASVQESAAHMSRREVESIVDKKVELLAAKAAPAELKLDDIANKVMKNIEKEIKYQKLRRM